MNIQKHNLISDFFKILRRLANNYNLESKLSTEINRQNIFPICSVLHGQNIDYFTYIDENDKIIKIHENIIDIVYKLKSTINFDSYFDFDLLHPKTIL